MLLFLLVGNPITALVTPLEAHKIRHLYLTCSDDATTSINIHVHGIRTPSDLIVYYDKKPCHGEIAKYQMGQAIKGHKISGLPDSRKIYHSQLTDLEPNTIYYATVGDRFGSFAQEIAFRTFPIDAPLVLIEGGDWENTESACLLAKKAASLSPHAILLGGDYPSYATDKLDYQQWDQWLDVYTQTMRTSHGLLIPMIMAIGNHEVSGGFGKACKDVPFYLDYFFENTYFSLSLGSDRHLFVLDSGHASSHDGAQKEWLSSELQKVAHKKVKMALYHVPLYPSIRFYEKNLLYYLAYGILKFFGEKSHANQLFSQESAQGRKSWLPLFDQYQMTAAFEHHDQTLKRTKPLKNDREDTHGTVYLGDGSFGAEYQFHPIQKYFHRYFAKILGKKHFFWAVFIQKQQISYAAVTAEGEIIDHFVQRLN